MECVAVFILFCVSTISAITTPSCGYVSGEMLTDRYVLRFAQSIVLNQKITKLTWFKEDPEISQVNKSYKYEISTNKLVIKSVSEGDIGNYFVDCLINQTTFTSSRWNFQLEHLKKGSLTTQTTKEVTIKIRKSTSTSTTTPWTPTNTATKKTKPNSKGSTASQTTDAATSINQPEPTEMHMEMTQTANTNTNTGASLPMTTALIHTMTTSSTTVSLSTPTSSQVTCTQTSIQTTETKTDNLTSTSHDKTTIMSGKDEEWILSRTTIIVIAVGAVLITLIVSLTVCITIRARRNEKSVSIGSNQPHAIYSTVNRPRYRNTTNGTPLAQNTVANQYAIFNIESSNCLNGTSRQSPLNYATGQTSVPSPSSGHYASVKRSLHPKPNIAYHVDNKTTEQDSQQMTNPATREQQVPELHYADLDLPAASRNIVQIKKEHDVNRCQYSDVDVHKIP